MEIKTKLLMTFKTSDDKKVSITVDNPREDLTETEIKEAMNTIIEGCSNWYYWLWLSFINHGLKFTNSCG